MVLRDRIEVRHDLLQHRGGLDHRVGHRVHVRGKPAHVVPLDALGRVLDQVDAVVQQMREAQDVLAIDRRVERAVGGDEDLARNRVGGHLDLANGRDVPPGSASRDHRPQLLRGLEDALRLLAKSGVKASSAGIRRLNRLSDMREVLVERRVAYHTGANAGPTAQASEASLPRSRAGTFGLSASVTTCSVSDLPFLQHRDAFAPQAGDRRHNPRSAPLPPTIPIAEPAQGAVRVGVYVALSATAVNANPPSRSAAPSVNPSGIPARLQGSHLLIGHVEHLDSMLLTTEAVYARTRWIAFVPLCLGMAIA